MNKLLPCASGSDHDGYKHRHAEHTRFPQLKHISVTITKILTMKIIIKIIMIMTYVVATSRSMRKKKMMKKESKKAKSSKGERGMATRVTIHRLVN